MQRSLIIFFCLIGLSVLGQDKKTANPGIRDIVKMFYGRYSPAVMSFEYPHVGIEKRKNGWYVVTQRPQRQSDGHYALEPIAKYLFYDNASRQYKPLPMKKVDVPIEVKLADYMDEPTLGFYDANLYYGYRGWYKDVIDELRKKKQLSDGELYSLGRAYSTSAADLVSDWGGDAVLKDVWQLPPGMNCMSPRQVARFDSLEATAQECFRKLAGRNPSFETTVGKIALKYADEVMFEYTIFLTYANDRARQMKLPDDLYSEEQLATARKNLENCPKDAILFSFGDNDYYPVHYLQQAKGIRRDIYLINYNIIGIDRFIHRSTFPQYDAWEIKLSVDSSCYWGVENDYIKLIDSSRAVTIDELIDLVRSKVTGDDEIKTLAANSIILPKEEAPIPIESKLPLNGYRGLLKNQWILLDILNNLDGRKICFPTMFDEDVIMGLNEHLVPWHGMYVYGN